MQKEVETKVRECVGCGYCCMKSTCVVGQLESGLPVYKPCPYLLWNDEMYRCELMGRGKDVGQGWGCCSNLNSWRKNVKFRGFKAEHYPPTETLEISEK